MSESNPNVKHFDVFLCHNSEDKPEIRRIADQLLRRGIKPWLDENEIQPGKPWQEILELQIGTIKAAAVFVGKSGIGPWQRMEMQAFINEFVERACPVIAVILPSATETPKLPILLKNLHWVDFRDAKPDPLEQLIWGITGHKPAHQVTTETVLLSPSEHEDKLDQAYQEGRRLYPPLATPPDQAQRAQLLILLGHVQRYWVNGVLKQSLPHEVSIALGKEVKEKAVESPWIYATPLPSALRELLLHDRNITTLFDATALLLILGEPGSGKTTTLLELADGLIARARNDPTERVPVVLNLSTWEQTESLEEWIAAELSGKYGVAKTIARAWLTQDYLVPLLDGLDELPTAIQPACVAAINAFIEARQPSGLVVCSRLVEYEWLPERLTLNGAVCLEPLSPEDVNQFLEARGTQLAGLQQAMRVDPVLRDVAQTPLMLEIMSLVCAGVSKEALSTDKADSPKTRQQHIFQLYVAQMFERRQSSTSPFTKEQTIGWLSWLARTMKERSRSIFMVEDLRPSWLSSKAKRRAYATVVALIVGLLGGLLCGLFGWLITMQFVEQLFWLGFSIGFVNGLDDALRNKIHVVETMSWKPKRYWKESILEHLNFAFLGTILNLVGLGIFLLLIMLTALLGGKPMGEMNMSLPEILLGVLLMGLLCLWMTLPHVLHEGLRHADLSNKVFPNQGITLSLKNGLLGGLLGGLSGGLWGGLSGGLFGSLSGELRVGLTGALMGGLIFGLLGTLSGWLHRGGSAVVKHYALRLILWLTGSTPLRFIPFLDHCAKLIFLKKVGGGYIFVHRTLLEYFAELPPQTPRASGLEKS